jgi:hypothetical protein
VVSLVAVRLNIIGRTDHLIPFPERIESRNLR